MQLLLIIILLQRAESCGIEKQRQLLRGNYENVFGLQNGGIISTRKVNYFAGGYDNGVLFRDSIYMVTGGTGFTYCVLGQSISFSLLQTFELNTLILWLWDGSVTRTYNIVVYASFQNTETIILDSIAVKSVVKIHFPDMLISQFRVFNRNGNSENSVLHVIKLEAYYKL